MEQNLAEVDASGTVFRQWNLGDILANYMLAAGDDPSTFVRPGTDWFHMNDALYDPRDDSLLVSSRENFLVKLDYATGAVRWVFGDATKYWHTFPSLASLGLSLDTGLVPVGQHGVTIRDDGNLMLFNDGMGSRNQPTGAPAGVTRTISAVSVYAIDDVARRATSVFDFDYGLFAPFCSSAYKAGDSLLVDYSQVDNGTHGRLVGFTGDRSVAFDFEIPAAGCNAGWNAVPVPFENLLFR